MEAMGRLTAGIAHDFNNMLTAMMGFSEQIEAQLLPSDPLHEMAGRVLRTGRSATDLIRQLMAFSRRQAMQPRVLDLTVEWDHMEKMLSHIIGEDIALEVTPGAGAWRVKMDPVQLQQVLVNLAVNARQAMPTGGRLGIEIINVTLDEEQAAGFVEAKAGDYVVMRMSDTGHGMSQEVQAHIFEPFFTTKPQGTGLGLATVYGVVTQSGGFIQVQSEEGQGATFSVYMPRTLEAVPVIVAETADPADMVGVETILVAEDNADVRSYACGVLSAQGYTVLEAEHGEAALGLAAGHEGTIHLLVADVVMPGVSGRVVAERLMESRPGLKVLHISGYTDEVLDTHGVLGTGVAFLNKPFNALKLVRTVRQVMRKPAQDDG